MLDNIYSTTSMAIPHPPRPENYGNFDLDPRWEIGEFKVGDIVECFQCLNGVMQPSKPDCGIISFVSGDTMSVCVGCNSQGRAVNVVINQLYHVRILEEHEYSKLATSLKKDAKPTKRPQMLRQAKKRTSQFLTRLRRESKLIHLKRNHTNQ